MTGRLYLISKAQKVQNRKASNAAITAAGATTSAAALATGGIPGARANGNAVWRMKRGEGKGVKRVVSTVRGVAPAAGATPGGILGYRHSIHAGGLYDFAMKEKEARRKKHPTSTDTFYRHHNAGKIAPERAIMRGMKHAHRVSNGVLAAGAATTAYGLSRTGKDKLQEHQNKVVRKAKTPDRQDAYHGTLLGVGGAGLAISGTATPVLHGFKRKYRRSASQHVDLAGKHVPAIAGRKLRKPTPSEAFGEKHYGVKPDLTQTMYPTHSDGDIGRKNLMAGASRRSAAAAGRHRGIAAQHRHFAEVFHNTGKVTGKLIVPSALVAGAGAGGLAARPRKKPVKKSEIRPGVFVRASELGPFERRGLKMNLQRKAADREVAGMFPTMRGLGAGRTTINVSPAQREARRQMKRGVRRAQGLPVTESRKPHRPVQKGLPRYLRDVAPGIGASGTRTFRGGQKLDRGDYAYLRVRAHQNGKQAGGALRDWQGKLKRTNPASERDIAALEGARRQVTEASARGRLARAGSQKVLRDNTPARRPRDPRRLP